MGGVSKEKLRFCGDVRFGPWFAKCGRKEIGGSVVKSKFGEKFMRDSCTEKVENFIQRLEGDSQSYGLCLE